MFRILLTAFVLLTVIVAAWFFIQWEEKSLDPGAIRNRLEQQQEE